MNELDDGQHRSTFQKIISAYKMGGVVLLNLFLLFMFVNWIAIAALETRDWLKAQGGSVIADSPWTKRALVYPGYTSEQIFDLFIETWEDVGYEYSPLSQFREKPATGTYVNVTENNFRRGNADQVWPPQPENINILVFGGSTTFGYGVADAETIPARLEVILREMSDSKVQIYNFGRAYFYSTHELFEYVRLLHEGIRPDVVIFIDGLNDFYAHNQDFLWTKNLETLLSDSQPSGWESLLAATKKLPISLLMNDLSRRFFGHQKTREQKADESINQLIEGGQGEQADFVIRRFIQNKKLIETVSNHFGVTPYFIWQPVPTYNYNLDHHLFKRADMGEHKYSAYGYERAREYFDNGAFGDRFQWCADIQNGMNKPLYVDAVHYTAEFSDIFARCIAEDAELLVGVRRLGK